MVSGFQPDPDMQPSGIGGELAVGRADAHIGHWCKGLPAGRKGLFVEGSPCPAEGLLEAAFGDRVDLDDGYTTRSGLFVQQVRTDHIPFIVEISGTTRSTAAEIGERLPFTGALDDLVLAEKRVVPEASTLNIQRIRCLIPGPEYSEGTEGGWLDGRLRVRRSMLGKLVITACRVFPRGGLTVQITSPSSLR